MNKSFNFLCQFPHLTSGDDNIHLPQQSGAGLIDLLFAQYSETTKREMKYAISHGQDLLTQYQPGFKTYCTNEFQGYILHYFPCQWFMAVIIQGMVFFFGLCCILSCCSFDSVWNSAFPDMVGDLSSIANSPSQPMSHEGKEFSCLIVIPYLQVGCEAEFINVCSALWASLSEHAVEVQSEIRLLVFSAHSLVLFRLI